MHFVQYFFLLFTFGICGLVYSNPYERNLNELSSRNQKITLSDHSVWRIVTQEKDEQNWQIGDPIVLEIPTFSFSHQYFLKNVRTSHILPVEFVVDDQANDEIFHLNEISSDGQLLYLEDRSVWSIGFNYSWTSQYWCKGDRIIIISASDLKGYYLINLDRFDECPYVYAEYSFHQGDIAYKHFISDVHVDRTKNTCFIQIENGFTFELQKNVFGNFDETIPERWQVGDEIILFSECFVNRENGASTRSMYLYLINLRTMQHGKVKFGNQEEGWFSHRITQVKKINRLSIYEVFLTLDDGSEWKIDDYDYCAHDWKVGDRVIISPNIYVSQSENRFLFFES